MVSVGSCVRTSFERELSTTSVVSPDTVQWVELSRQWSCFGVVVLSAIVVVRGGGSCYFVGKSNGVWNVCGNYHNVNALIHENNYDKKKTNTMRMFHEPWELLFLLL